MNPPLCTLLQPLWSVHSKKNLPIRSRRRWIFICLTRIVVGGWGFWISSAEAFGSVLKYLYTGCFTTHKSNLGGVINVLRNFKLTDLRERILKKYDYLFREDSDETLKEQEKFCKWYFIYWSPIDSFGYILVKYSYFLVTYWYYWN